MKLNNKIHIGMLPTLLLVLAMGIFLLTGSVLINNAARETCFDTMEEATKQLAQDIQKSFTSNQEQLEVIAGFLGEHTELTTETVKKHLSSFEQRGSIGALVMLLPGNELVYCNGEKLSFMQDLDFATEAAKGSYISGVMAEGEETENTNKYVYQTALVESEGRIKGILYGIIDLRNLPENYYTEFFHDTAECYLLDTQTGDFIMDTWHDYLGNLYDGTAGGREAKKGFTYEDYLEDLKAGKTSYMAFRSLAAEEDYYIYAIPVGINQWMLQLTVPESEVFANANYIRRVFVILAVGYGVLFVCYLCWILLQVVRTYHRLEYMGNYDAVTGLKNRNSYESRVKAYSDSKEKQLCCIFIDANGLHELNNRKGHAAGDKMLHEIGQTLQVQFGEDTAYRIGGDEFVVFCENCAPEMIRKRADRLKTLLDEKGYSVSVGMAWREKAMSIDSLIANAEQKMYREKARYYAENKSRDRRSR